MARLVVCLFDFCLWLAVVCCCGFVSCKFRCWCFVCVSCYFRYNLCFFVVGSFQGLGWFFLGFMGEVVAYCGFCGVCVLQTLRVVVLLRMLFGKFRVCLLCFQEICLCRCLACIVGRVVLVWRFVLITA